MIIDINFTIGGEYYNEGGSLLREILGGTLTIIFTVLITQFAQRLYDNFKRNEYLDLLYKHTKKQSEELVKAAEKQAEGLRGLTKALLAKEVGHYDVKKVTGFDVSLIRDWESIDFFLAVISRRKYTTNGKEDISELITYHAKIKSLLNTIKKYQEAIEGNFSDLNTRYKEAQNMWSADVQNIGTLYDYYRLSSPDLENDDFCKEYGRIVYEWQTTSPKDNLTEKSNVYEKVILPLNDLSKKYMQGQRDMRAFQLSVEVLKLKAAFQEISEVKIRFGSWFEEMADKLEIAASDIPKAFAIVDILPIKSKVQFRSDKI